MFDSQKRTAAQTSPNETQWVVAPFDAATAEHLQTALNVEAVFGRLLAQRGITNFEEAKLFFRPQLVHLHDPFLMADMDKAVERLEIALEKRERILLYGDYDVDGTTSVALMFHALSRFTNNIEYYIPDRYQEGYGLSAKGIEYAAQTGVQLLITLDCGIQSQELIAKGNSLGIDTIVCDHHLPAATLPPAVAVLDAKRKDCQYPYKELSGCGVGFKLLQAYIEKNQLDFSLLEELLDLVAISITCDIVDMTNENRVLAFYGLQKINHAPRVGVHHLIKNSGKEPPLSTTDIVFGIGPMINAAGRLGDAKQAVRLLLAEDKFVAEDYARFLSGQNKSRQDQDKQIVKEAKEMLAESFAKKPSKSIVLFKPDWHKGIIGISASRLVEAFHRPTIVLTESKGKIVGSGRSIFGFDLHAALCDCADLLENFGGHTHAAGMTLAHEHLETFKNRFEAIAAAALNDEMLRPTLFVSAELRLSDITPKFWRILKQFAPFGPKNRRPVFLARGVFNAGNTRLLKDNHLKLSIRQEDSSPIEGIAFNLGHYHDLVTSGQLFDVCFVLEEHHWRGTTSIRIDVRDIRPHEML